MTIDIQFKRGTKSNIDLLASKARLSEGEPLFATDEDKLYIAKSPSTYTSALSSLSNPNGSADIGYLPAGTGAVPTNVQSKLREMVSVSGFETVQEAVAHAYLNNVPLYWPSLITVSSNIPNFHAVRHYGPGGVIRGADTFYVDIKAEQQNTLYVSTSGALDNDGISATTPTMLQQALNNLANYGPVLNGKWTIKLASGIYTSTDNKLPFGLRSKKLISIQGPDVGGHPNVPSAVIDGTGGASQDGFIFRSGVSVEVKDIKITDMGSTAIAITDQSLLSCINVHQTNCYSGISALNLCEYYVSGGIHTWTSGTGVYMLRSLSGVKHHIGFRYDENSGYPIEDISGNGPQLIGNGTGIGLAVQESCMGHIENSTIDGFSRGILLTSNARAHIGNNSFKNCGNAAIEVASTCNIYEYNNDFNIGTYDKNSRNIKYIGGVEVTRDGQYEMYQEAWSKLTSSIYTGTGEQTVHNVFTFNGYEFEGSGSKLRVLLRGTISGTSGAKTFRLRKDDQSTGAIFISSTIPTVLGSFFEIEFSLFSIEKNTFNIYAKLIQGDNAPALGGSDFTRNANTTINFANGTQHPIYLTVELLSESDSVTIDHIEVYRMG